VAPAGFFPVGSGQNGQVAMKTIPITRQISPFGIRRGSQILDEPQTRLTARTIACSAIEELRHKPLLGWAVVAFLLLCALSSVLGTVAGLINFRDVGYPDSSDLLRIREVVQSGIIYPDGDRAPYLVSLYGPLTYILLSMPYRLAVAAGITPQMLVRLGVVIAASMCVFLVYLINKRLYGSKPIALLCALFALSAVPLGEWTTQIRGDFLGLSLALLGFYLFVSSRWRPLFIAAAVSAGLAPLCKQTFIAAPVAIFAWLIYKRRYQDAALWSLSFGLTLAVGYGIVMWHEPFMMKSVTVMHHPVLEYTRAFVIFLEAVGQPVTPFAAVGALAILGRRERDRLPLLVYCVAAWLLAILIVPQAGGKINYFWEPLFASAVLAGPGLRELQRRVIHIPALATAMVLLLLFWSFVPLLREQLSVLNLSRTNLREYGPRKQRWESFVSVVSGHRLLSTSSDVSVLSTMPEMPDPFLNASLELRGGWDSRPIEAQIDAGVYDLIVTNDQEADKHQDDYRGVRMWSEGMWRALKSNYGPVCVLANDKYAEKFGTEGAEEVWLPRHGPHNILPRLLEIGCVPLPQPIETDTVNTAQLQLNSR
jgi:hypothetical protein